MYCTAGSSDIYAVRKGGGREGGWKGKGSGRIKVNPVVECSVVTSHPALGEIGWFTAVQLLQYNFSYLLGNKTAC